MFRYLADDAPDKNQQQVCITINDRNVTVPANSSVWAAMAASGETTTRISAVSQQPRSAYCAMGACFECLVEIDGLPNQQACMSRVCQGMEIRSQVITETSQAAVTGQYYDAGTDQEAGHD